MKKMTTDPKMLELLVCPMTKGTLSFNRKTQELVSYKAKLAYPIRDGVPIMLASEARPLQNNEEITRKK
ncbi:Trm112 family protein [Bartonella sp. AP58NXGY]|uniref:Trm112 family protein n=1 Tax=Bartonella sp. AP58NXGY TaxID=3243498 RepID=UPI0035CFE3E0